MILNQAITSFSLIKPQSKKLMKSFFKENYELISLNSGITITRNLISQKKLIE